MYYEIKVGSVTNAQRSMRILKSRGYRPTMSRMENPKKTDGCGYVIKVYCEDDKVLGILKASGISVLGVEAI